MAFRRNNEADFCTHRPPRRKWSHEAVQWPTITQVDGFVEKEKDYNSNSKRSVRHVLCSSDSGGYGSTDAWHLENRENSMGSTGPSICYGPSETGKRFDVSGQDTHQQGVRTARMGKVSGRVGQYFSGDRVQGALQHHRVLRRWKRKSQGSSGGLVSGRRTLSHHHPSARFSGGGLRVPRLFW